MHVGFISGDLVEVTNQRKGVSVPDYPVQGFLMRKLVERGHKVTLFTRCPKDDAGAVPVEYRPGDDPTGVDVLFGDRLGPYGSEYDTQTIRQLEQYSGPIVYHQYVPYSGWAPQFREMPHLLGHQRQWTIVNRSPDVQKAYHVMAGWKEGIIDTVGDVRWRQWEPFLMLEYPWDMEYVRWDEVEHRPYVQGYFGRVPKRERRARSVVRWLEAGDWKRIVYGPETSTAYVSAETGAVNGGRVLHKDLPQALETFNVIVQSPIDRLQNKGQLRYWPHRIVECALAGVVQFFDPGIGIPEFKPWEVRTPDAFRNAMHVLEDIDTMREQVLRQQEIIVPRADPVKVMDRLEDILKEAASGDGETS